MNQLPGQYDKNPRETTEYGEPACMVRLPSLYSQQEEAMHCSVFTDEQIEHLNAWIIEMRTGIPQTRHHIFKNDAMCCLGVACSIYPGAELREQEFNGQDFMHATDADILGIYVTSDYNGSLGLSSGFDDDDEAREYGQELVGRVLSNGAMPTREVLNYYGIDDLGHEFATLNDEFGANFTQISQMVVDLIALSDEAKERGQLYIDHQELRELFIETGRKAAELRLSNAFY